MLDFLSSHPSRTFTLTEIAQAIGVNATSTLSILLGLVETGYVVRDPVHKTYVLGPGLVMLGHSALVRHPVLGAASQEMKLLAEEISAQCVGSVRMGDEIVAVVNEGRPRRLASLSWIGSRVPFTPPFGATFVAYEDDERRTAWVESAGISDAKQKKLMAELEAVRKCGFAIELESSERESLAQALVEALDAPRDDELRQEVRRLARELISNFTVKDLGTDEEIDLSYISVPIHSPHGEVVMSITATGFPAPMTGSTVGSTAERMRASAETISRKAFGGTRVATP